MPQGRSDEKALARVSAFAALLLAWELGSATKLLDPVSVPRVSVIAAAWVEAIRNGQLLNHLLPSLWRIFAGFGLAVVVAVPLGLLMGTISLCYRLLEPISEFIRPIPGRGLHSDRYTFSRHRQRDENFRRVPGLPVFPVLLNTYGGVRGIDPVLVDTGRSFGVSRLKALWQIVFPAALPSILTGMRISLGIALIVAVVSEMIAGNSGIGYFILDMQRIFRVPDMFAGIFTLGLLGFLINFAFLKIEQHFLRWRGTSVET